MLTIHEACEQAYKRGLEDGRKESAEALRAAEVVAKHHWDLYCQALANSMAWIPVKEKMPEKNGYYFVLTDTGVWAALPYSSVHRAFNAFDDDKNASCLIPCTYWMRIPEPPKGE